MKQNPKNADGLAAVASSALLGVMVLVHVASARGESAPWRHCFPRPGYDKAKVGTMGTPKTIPIPDMAPESMLPFPLYQQLEAFKADRSRLIEHKREGDVWGNRLVGQRKALGKHLLLGVEWSIRRRNGNRDGLDEARSLSRVLDVNHNSGVLWRIGRIEMDKVHAKPRPLINLEIATRFTPLFVCDENQNQSSDYSSYFHPRFPPLYKWLLFVGGAWCLAWGWISLRNNRNGDVAGWVFFAGIACFIWGMFSVLPWLVAL